MVHSSDHCHEIQLPVYVLFTRHDHHRDQVEAPPLWLGYPDIIRISAIRPGYVDFSLWVQELGPRAERYLLQAESKADKSNNVLAKLSKGYRDLSSAFAAKNGQSPGSP